MRVQCPRCRTLVEALPGGVAQCPSCGFSAPMPAAPAPPPAEFLPYAPDAVDAYTPAPPKPPRVITRSVLQRALWMNLFVPGWGTLHAGREGEGALQLGLFLVGILLAIVLIGLALVAAAWVWALVASVQHLNAFPAGPRAPVRP